MCRKSWVDSEKRTSEQWLGKKSNHCLWMCKSERTPLVLLIFSNTSASTLTSFPVWASWAQGSALGEWERARFNKNLSEGYKTLIYVLRMDSMLSFFLLSPLRLHSRDSSESFCCHFGMKEKIVSFSPRRSDWAFSLMGTSSAALNREEGKALIGCGMEIILETVSQMRL